MGEILLHILFIANCVSLYGANRSMLDLAVELRRLGQDVFFFFPQQENGEERHKMKQELIKNGFAYVFLNYFSSVHSSDEKNIIRRRLRKEINQRCLLKMKDYVQRWKIDIIHTNSLTHTIGLSLSRQLNKPHVWHIREALQKDYDLYFDNLWDYWYGLKRTEQIICISNFIKKTHKKMLTGTKTSVLYNGFNIENYLLEEAYDKEIETFTIIICGVIRKEKGQLDAVKAIEYLIRKYKVKNIHLQIVGDGFGNYYDEINKFIKIYDLGQYIDILPFQKNLRELRKNADIALMCSESEAFGRVTIESMLSENVVIGADSGGTAEIIEDGVTGYLYKVNNVKDLGEKIHYVITHWKAQEKIIKSAKLYARMNYGIESYAKRMLNLYNDLLQ